MRILALITLGLSLLTFRPSAAEEIDPLDNWPQWRGPLASGFAPKGDPPLKWDSQDHMKWKAAIPGRGSATPIVWGDLVFVLTAVDTGRAAETTALVKSDSRFEKKTQPPTTYHQFLVLALERTTGKVRWQQVATERVPHEGRHPTHSYAAASPVTDGRFLYVSFGSQGLYCYRLDGKLEWHRDLGRMETRYGWGEGISPVLHGDTLVMNWDHEAGSFIVALDARTGKTLWKVERDEPTSWATPLVITHQGRTQVIVNATKRIRSYDLTTGQLLWQCGGQTVNVIPSPVANDRVVVCMSGYRGSAASAVRLDASGDVTETTQVIWRYDRGTPYVPSPLLADGRLYFTQANSGLLTCLDIASGKPLIDRERLPALNSLYSSPVAAKDRIYLVARDGTALVIRRSDKLEILATNRLDDPVDASPAIAGKQLFLRGEKYLYCIE
jgi:outer membrane protein assembly factor BamB